MSRTQDADLSGQDEQGSVGQVNETDEARAVVLVKVRLRARFPMLRGEVIEQVVDACHREFNGSPIRDFVPILVERQARDELSAAPRLRSAAAVTFEDRPAGAAEERPRGHPPLVPVQFVGPAGRPALLPIQVRGAEEGHARRRRP